MEGRWLFVSDVDDTLTGDDDALATLMAELQRAWDRVTVVYNSGRLVAAVRKMIANVPHLPVPRFIIGGVGTEIEEGDSGRELDGYRDRIGRGWQRAKVAAIMDEFDFEAHEPESQGPFKVSYNVWDMESYRQVLERLEAAGLQTKVVYSSHKNLDILPPLADKGKAIEYLRQWLGIEPQQVVVAGDSGNDIEMFVPPFKGIVVGNAQEELKQLQGDDIYHAKDSHAAGVLEGLRYWGVVE